MKSRAQLSWNSTFRWAPTSRTGGVLLRAKIIFWNETFFQKWFLLTDLFYFYMYLLFFFFVFSSFSVIYFCHCFLGLFSYLIYFNKFLFSTYLFFLSHLEHRLHQQTPWMISSTNNNKPRAVNGLLVWNWSNTKPIRYLKHIRDIKHILHIHHFKLIKILTRRSRENQAIVFEHEKHNTCISQNVSFYRKVALCKLYLATIRK